MLSKLGCLKFSDVGGEGVGVAKTGQSAGKFCFTQQMRYLKGNFERDCLWLT